MSYRQTTRRRRNGLGPQNRNIALHRMVFKIGVNFICISQYGFHVVLMGVLIVVAAVIGINCPPLVFGIAVPTARYEVMRNAQNGVVGVKKINTTVAIAVHSHAERGGLELHEP